MIFAEISDRESVFVDANAFVYHFTPHPTFKAACSDFLDRIEHGDLLGFTSTHVLTDVAHRLMTTEAIKRNGWPVSGIAQRLRKHAHEIGNLTIFRQAVDEIPRLGLHILVPPPTVVSAAAAISQQYFLLSGDALIVAIMQQFGITALASHDADFDRVPWLKRYGPA